MPASDEVVRPSVAADLFSDKFTWWHGDLELGVTGPSLRRFLAEEVAVEGDGLLQVFHRQPHADAGSASNCTADSFFMAISLVQW